MAKKRSSFFPTYVLCLIFLAVGWFIGSQHTEKFVENAPVADERAMVPSSSSEGVASTVEDRSPGSSPSESLEIDFSKGPAVLLKQAEAIEDPARRQLFLRQLIGHWIEADSQYPQEQRDKFFAGMPPQPGFEHRAGEVVYSYYVSLLTDSNLRDSWKTSFGNHPARSDIYSLFSFKDVGNGDPRDLIRKTGHWNQWEKDVYHQNVLKNWAHNEPSHAFAWYQANKSQFPSETKDSIFEMWAHSDFDGLAVHLDSLLDNATRESALDALATEMARKGTDGALDWANSLGSVEDQNLAHDTIYRETPRGIGAVLRHEHGFPMVHEPLVDNGLQPGDLIISARNGEVTTEFYGQDLLSAVETLIGTPGTDVTVQVMRQDPASGEYRQTEITITRQQLWMEGEEDEEERKKP